MLLVRELLLLRLLGLLWVRVWVHRVRMQAHVCHAHRVVRVVVMVVGGWRVWVRVRVELMAC